MNFFLEPSKSTTDSRTYNKGCCWFGYINWRGIKNPYLKKKSLSSPKNISLLKFWRVFTVTANLVKKEMLLYVETHEIEKISNARSTFFKIESILASLPKIPYWYIWNCQCSGAPKIIRIQTNLHLNSSLENLGFTLILIWNDTLRKCCDWLFNQDCCNIGSIKSYIDYF